MGYQAVDVAQRIDLNYSGGNLNISFKTNVFPSAVATVTGFDSFGFKSPTFKIMEYFQPSLRRPILRVDQRLLLIFIRDEKAFFLKIVLASLFFNFLYFLIWNFITVSNDPWSLTADIVKYFPSSLFYMLPMYVLSLFYIVLAFIIKLLISHRWTTIVLVLIILLVDLYFADKIYYVENVSVLKVLSYRILISFLFLCYTVCSISKKG